MERLFLSIVCARTRSLDALFGRTIFRGRFRARYRSQAMYSSRAKWDRHELYQKVWEFPLRKLAEEYGISDVGLAKVCRKLQIPLPGLGHWTKIACGHKIPRPPLPEANDLP